MWQIDVDVVRKKADEVFVEDGTSQVDIDACLRRVMSAAVCDRIVATHPNLYTVHRARARAATLRERVGYHDPCLLPVVP